MVSLVVGVHLNPVVPVQLSDPHGDVVLAMADEIWMTWKSIIAQEMEGNSERTLESVDDAACGGHGDEQSETGGYP